MFFLTLISSPGPRQFQNGGVVRKRAGKWTNEIHAQRIENSKWLRIISFKEDQIFKDVYCTETPFLCF